MSGVYVLLVMPEGTHDLNRMRQSRLTRARIELNTGW
jgi:hypothetical protein